MTRRYMQTRHALLSGVAMTPSERRLGRYLRAPEGHEEGGAGGDSGAGGDNTGGNSGNQGGSEGNNGNQGNNTGNAFEPSAFWDSPQDETTPPSNQGGSAGGNQSGGNQQQGNEGNAFRDALNGLNFGQGVFTPEAVEAMNNGDPKNFNENMTGFGREVTRQAVIMAAQLMQKNNEAMNQRFEALVEERFGLQATESDLGKAIPSYAKPGMKPIIDGIMGQALKLTKGKRSEAIEMTKEMLKFQATNLGADFNITTPPSGAGNDFGTGQTTNWEEELLGR